MNIKQKRILRKLVCINGQKYSQLYNGFQEDDKFAYHLKYLTSKGYVNKRENKYFLTKEGMKITAFFDSQTLQDDNIPTTMLLFICKYKNKYYINEHFDNDPNIERHFLAFPSAKPILGKTLEESSKIGFFKKEGIDGDFQYQCTVHYTNFATDKDVLFDTIFIVFKAEIEKSEYETSDMSKWRTIEELKSIDKKSIIIQKLLIDSCKEKYLQCNVVYNYGFDIEDIV